MTSPKLLLVDDNPDDVLLTIRAFKKSRIANEIVVARDGAEALDQLLGVRTEEQPVLPHVVLLDLKLPKIDGLTVLRRLRDNERTRLLPIIIFTSSDEQRDIIDGYQFGANSYVRKPVDFLQLQEAIATLGLYWLVLNRQPDGPLP